jgi:FkbM family methyltransferase
MYETVKVVARALTSIIAACPGSSTLVRRSAIAPVSLKTLLFQRVISRIALRTPIAGLVDTNLGIDDGLRILVPSTKYYLLYGKPSNHVAERATLELATVLAARSAVFVDVGANEGLFTFQIAAALGASRHASIHAFEPDPVLFDRFASNLARNNIGARVNRTAVSDHDGRQCFYRNLVDDLSGSLMAQFSAEHETVAVETDVTSLASYLAANRIENACVKIDVEGAGVAAWAGLRPAQDRIKWLIMEIVGPEARANLPGRIITETGWNAYYIRDYELVQSHTGEFEYRAPFYNWLFCPAGSESLVATLKATPFSISSLAATRT